MSKATVTIVFETAGEQQNFKKSLRRIKDSKKIKYSKIVQNAVLEYEQKNCQSGGIGKTLTFRRGMQS
jgi:hypothetical protein